MLDDEIRNTKHLSIATYLLLFSIGLLTSLAAIYAFHLAHIPFDYQGDTGKYVRPALGLLQHGKFGQYTNGIFHPETERLLFYPGMIYLCYALFGLGNNLAVVLLQAVLVGGVVVAIAAIVNRIDSRFMWVAAILTALCPNLFFRAPVMLPDLLFMFFVACGICLLVYSFRAHFYRNYILSTLLFGCAFYTRPVFMLFPLLTFPCLVYAIKIHKKVSLSGAFGRGLISICILVLMLLPQLIREHHYSGKYVLTTQSGKHALLWLYPCFETKWGGRRNIHALNRAEAVFHKKYHEMTSSGPVSIGELNHMQMQLAITLFKKIPVKQVITAGVGSSLKLLFYTSFLGTAEAFHHHIPHVNLLVSQVGQTIKNLLANPWQVTILMAELLILLLRAVQIIGLAYGIYNRRYRALALYLIAAAISFIAVSVGPGNPRYRVPIEPELIIFTIFGMMAIRDYLRVKREKRSSVMLPVTRV